MTIRENKWENVDVVLFLLGHGFLYLIKRDPKFRRNFLPLMGFNLNVKKIFPHTRGTTQMVGQMAERQSAARTYDLKTHDRMDIWPKDS